MKIRQATINDFAALYKIGLETPEFKVSAESDFMDQDEFKSALNNPDGVFLLAEADKEIIGFIYFSRRDIERAPETNWACLVYLVVKPEYRKQGIAQKLYEAGVQELKKFAITNIYGWANSESDGSIINFLEHNGFTQGHKYVWMDRKI